jgi:hypothetical protein
MHSPISVKWQLKPKVNFSKSLNFWIEFEPGFFGSHNSVYFAESCDVWHVMFWAGLYKCYIFTNSFCANFLSTKKIINKNCNLKILFQIKKLFVKCCWNGHLAFPIGLFCKQILTRRFEVDCLQRRQTKTVSKLPATLNSRPYSVTTCWLANHPSGHLRVTYSLSKFCSKFHQHFTSSFCANIILPK